MPDSTIIIAAGGVVWKDTRKGPVIAVIHRPKYKDWSLPKGKIPTMKYLNSMIQ